MRPFERLVKDSRSHNEMKGAAPSAVYDISAFIFQSVSKASSNITSAVYDKPEFISQSVSKASYNINGSGAGFA